MPSVVEFKVAKNNASSSLASAINNSVGTLTVATGDGGNFPATADGDFWVSIDSEILLCTSRTGDVLTVTRAQQSTSGAAHDSGAAVELRITAESISEIQDEIKHGVLEGWALDDDQNPSLGTLPVNAFVYRVDVWVEEGFDSDAADDLTVGYGADSDAYVALGLNMATGGLREHIDEGHAQAGSNVGIQDPTSRAVEIYYINGGTEPTTGKVYVALHYIISTAEPA